MGKNKKAGKSAAAKPPVNTDTKSTGFNITRIHVILLLVVFFVAYLNIFDEKLDMNGDNLWYYILGKSLAAGKGFSNILQPNVTPHNHFPPGYPFIISIFLRMGFDSFTFYHVLNGIFTALSVVVFYLFLNKTGIKKNLSFIICAFVALNANILQYATINMSEVPFMFFSIAALYFAVSADYEKKPYLNPLFFLMMACVIIAYYIRTTGITLLFAIIVFLLFRKRWMYALSSFLLFFVSILPWQIRSARLGGNDYVHQLLMKNPYNPALGQAGVKDFVFRFLQNLARYITIEIPTSIGTGTFEIKNGPPPLSYWIVGLFLLFLIIYGMVKLFKTQPVTVIYLFATGGTLLLWPSQWFGVRFMMPVIPIIIMFALYGLDLLLDLLFKRYKLGWSPYVLLVILLLMISPLKALKEKAGGTYPAQFQNFFDMASWAGSNLPANSVVCSRKPEFFYIYSNLKSTNYTYTANDTLLLQDLQKDSVHYVVVDQLGFSSTGRYLVPAIQKNPKRFKLIREIKDPDTYLLRFD